MPVLMLIGKTRNTVVQFNTNKNNLDGAGGVITIVCEPQENLTFARNSVDAPNAATSRLCREPTAGSPEHGRVPCPASAPLGERRPRCGSPHWLPREPAGRGARSAPRDLAEHHVGTPPDPCGDHYFPQASRRPLGRSLPGGPRPHRAMGSSPGAPRRQYRRRSTPKSIASTVEIKVGTCCVTSL